MGPSPYRRLDNVIDEATLHEARIDTDARTARLRLGVLLHTTSPDAPQPERTLVLHDLSRAAVCLRRLRQERRTRRESAASSGSGSSGSSGEPRSSGRHAKPAPPAKVPGPPILLRDAEGVASWLDRWSGCELYDQPAEIFDAAIAPEWLLQPSIDLTWPAVSRVHTMDLGLAERRGPGGHLYRLDVRLEFGALEVLNGGDATEDPGALADAVAAWWQDMHEGLTNGQYGLYPADSPVAV